MTTQQESALENAHDAPRCQHVRLNGVRCGSPAVSGRRLCYYHQQARRPKRPNYDLPIIEDAASIQFGLVQVIRALQDKAHDTKTCALLIYALQTASANLKQLAREQQEAEYINGPSLAEIMLDRLEEMAKQDAARAAAEAAPGTLPKSPPATAAVGLNPRTEAASD
ncbi:MAG TPA: hypothetical protein VNK82_01965 [Terriglobales bacterium]|nr:hypothetical protein [Terriglobales bacterium]